MSSHARRCDLVLGGGGVRGLAHVGALTALDEAGLRPWRVAGASAGAIVGAFAVAGITPEDVRARFEELDLRGFALSDLVGRLTDARAIGGIVTRIAPARTEPLQWLEEVLASHGVETFADLHIDDPDLPVPPERAYRLVVRCLDVVQRRVVRLPWDYPLYGLDPGSQSVAGAVRASMSIPLVYEPVPIGPADDPRGGLLVDGGLTSGFPVALLDRDDGRPPRWPTFGIRLLRRPQGGGVPDGELAMVRAVLDAMRDTSDLLEPQTDCDERRTIRIDASEVRAFDLDLGDDHGLFDEGHRATAGFLRTWDLDAYVAACREHAVEVTNPRR